MCGMNYREKKGLFSRKPFHFLSVCSRSPLKWLLHHHYSANSVIAYFPAIYNTGMKFASIWEEGSEGRRGTTSTRPNGRECLC